MPFLKLILPIGLMGFGAVAAFMGFVVLTHSMSTGRIIYSTVSDGRTVTRTVVQADDPALYRTTVIWAGWLPLLLGCGAVWYGRRQLQR